MLIRLRVRELISTAYLGSFQNKKMASENWWFSFLFVMATVLVAVNSRYVDNQASSALPQTEYDDDLDLELLNDYYDELVQEYTNLKKELNLERIKMEKTKEFEDSVKLQMKEKMEEELELEETRLAEKLQMKEEMEEKLELEETRLAEKLQIKEKMEGVLELEETELAEKIAREDDKMNMMMADYDYMSDAADPPPAPELSTQIKVSQLYNVTNLARGLLDQNETVEDPSLVKLQRERNKELRLTDIRDRIMKMRGGNPDGNSTIPSTRTLQELLAANKDLIPNASTNSYTEKVQSFYPSCEVPKHADGELWVDATSMNLLFDVTYPSPALGSAINVLSAKLRLYKIPQVNVTAAPEPSAVNYRSKPEKSLLNQYGAMHSSSTVDDDRLLRVSVYWYTRSLKKNRVKRKLVDSRMYNIVRGEWIEFNIWSAVRAWKQMGRNYGLVVTVEDDDGVLLPAAHYVHAMNCSKDAATVKPLPSIVVDATKQYLMEHPEANQTQNDATANSTSVDADPDADSDADAEEVNPFPYSNYLFPILDVTTIEVPDHEAATFSNTNTHTNHAASVIVQRANSTADHTSIQGRRADVQRSTLFNTVGLGSPAAGPNRNNLVPILTKSDVVTSPEDVRMKNELLKIQAERTDAPRRRHSRKLVSNSA